MNCIKLSKLSNIFLKKTAQDGVVFDNELGDLSFTIDTTKKILTSINEAISAIEPLAESLDSDRLKQAISLMNEYTSYLEKYIEVSSDIYQYLLELDSSVLQQPYEETKKEYMEIIQLAFQIVNKPQQYWRSIEKLMISEDGSRFEEWFDTKAIGSPMIDAAVSAWENVIDPEEIGPALREWVKPGELVDVIKSVAEV